MYDSHDSYAYLVQLGGRQQPLLSVAEPKYNKNECQHNNITNVETQ